MKCTRIKHELYGKAVFKNRDTGEYEEFKCKDCDIEEPTMFMLKDEVWLSVCKPGDVLCFDCTEKRLGCTINLQMLQTDNGLWREMMLGVRIFLQTAVQDIPDEVQWRR